MAGLHIARISMLLRIKVPKQSLQENLPAPIDRFGEQVAKQVMDYDSEHRLGYFPALGFFGQNNEQCKDQRGVDAYLLSAAQQIAEVAITHTRKEVLKALLPVFSSVHIESVNVMAFTLPAIRPGNNHAFEKLAAHYTPDTIQFELQVTIIQKHQSVGSLEQGVEKIVRQWLTDKFEHVEITAIRLLQ